MYLRISHQQREVTTTWLRISSFDDQPDANFIITYSNIFGAVLGAQVLMIFTTYLLTRIFN